MTRRVINSKSPLDAVKPTNGQLYINGGQAIIQQTRLQLVNANGDLEIDGEITGYNQYNEAVAADGYSSKVKLTMTVNVRYVNNTNHEEDFEQQFSAFQTYDSSLLLTDVQDDLISKMIKDITEQIFNSTVANW